MQSPIPDPFATPGKAATLVKGPRPTSLIWMIAISWLLGLASAALSNPAEAAQLSPAVIAISWLITVLVDYALWQGRNWARIISLLFAVSSLLNCIDLDLQSFRFLAADFCAGLYGVVRLIYLTRSSVVAYFKGLPPLPQAQ